MISGFNALIRLINGSILTTITFKKDFSGFVTYSTMKQMHFAIAYHVFTHDAPMWYSNITS